MSLEKISSRIGQKDWNYVFDLWLNFLPQIGFPFTEPVTSTHEIEPLRAISHEIIGTESRSTTREHYYTVPGLHPLIFLEAVYLFYKSLNVLKSSQCDTLKGFKTWSVANSYQGSYFGLKCFLDLIGVHSARIGNKDFLIDLHPSYRSLPKKEVTKRRSDYEVCIQLTKQFEHWEYWYIFQRVLRISKNLPLAEPVVDFLTSLDPKLFARQRNDIIYYNTRWLFQDLKDLLLDPDFAVRKLADSKEVYYATNDEAFTTMNAFLLLQMNYTLLARIAGASKNFEQEFGVVNVCIAEDSNSIFQRFVEVQG